MPTDILSILATISILILLIITSKLREARPKLSKSIRGISILISFIMIWILVSRMSEMIEKEKFEWSIVGFIAIWGIVAFYIMTEIIMHSD